MTQYIREPTQRIEFADSFETLRKKARRASMPPNCPNCGRFVKVEDSGSYDSCAWWWYGICKKCGEVTDSA